MLTPEEINAAYNEFAATLERLLQAKVERERIEESVKSENVAELMEAKNAEMRNLISQSHLDENAGYESARREFEAAEIAHELAKVEVYRVRALIEFSRGSYAERMGE